MKTNVNVQENVISMHIDCDEQCNGVQIKHIMIYAAIFDPYEIDDVDFDYEEDLAVYWEVEEEIDSTQDMCTNGLLMRDPNGTSKTTQTMNNFYWGNAYTDRLKQILLENGFSEEAVEDVCTSEWGMQEAGRISFDAYKLAREIVARFLTEEHKKQLNEMYDFNTF